MKYKFIVLSFLVLSLTGFRGFGQAPANDDYTGAVALTVNPGYTANNVASGTTVGATQSAQPGCNSNAHDDDVWYKFTATKASHIIRLSNVTTASGWYNERTIEAFTNVSDAPGEQIHCSSSNLSISEGLLTGLTVGHTYFVRIYAYYTWSGLPDRINFNISILTPPNPPANDEQAGAAPLTINTAYDPTHFTPGTTDGATRSSTVAACNAGNDDDVWYKFTAARPSHIVRLSSISQAYGANRSNYIEVFTSVDGQPGERILCSSNGNTAMHEGLLTGLTVNETYFVRVYAEYAFGGVADRINFNISVLTPPNSPANDGPAGATELTVNQDYACQNAIAGTTDGATRSGAVAACNAGNDDDVWYKFTAARPSHIVRLSSISQAYGTNRNNYIEVFTSVDGQPGERILCSSNGNTATHEGLLTGLTVNETYFVRVYAQYAFDGMADRINFNICIISPVYPPDNDEYTDAEMLAVNENNTCTNSATGTTDGATQSEQSACNTNENDDDVWYSFEATNAAHSIHLSNVSLAYGDTPAYTIEVLREEEGAPGGLIVCESSQAQSHEVYLAGLTVGNTYFVRIYANYAFSGVANRINFNLCILTPPVPANNECTAAVDISNGNQVPGTTNGATESLPAGTCGSGYAYDVWYKVTPASSGALTVTAYTDDFNLVLEAFTGSCESLASIACKNDADGSESLTIADAVEGTTYYFRVYNNTPAAARVAAETGNFTIQVSGTALPVTLASFKASLSENNSVRLDWATTVEANASHFDIEHSLTGREWNKIGEMKAVGEHTGLKSYTYIHTNPSLSVNYYRLKSVDLDGTFAYSAIESIRLSGQVKQLVAYPNPVSDRLYLKAATSGRIPAAKLYNAAGREVKAPLDAATQSLDVRHLPAGVYLLKVDGTDGVSETFRVVISR